MRLIFLAWMMMHNRKGMPLGLILYIIFIFKLEAIGSLSTNDSPNPETVLDSLISAINHPGGHTFNVQWTYAYNNDIWTGDGTVYILGKDYFKLILPYQEVLIQKSTVMIKYPETDQVVIDYFNRNDPSNIYALFLGEFDTFDVQSISQEKSAIDLYLKSKMLVGFDRLKISVDKKSWLPQMIYAEVGEDISISVRIVGVTSLIDTKSLTEEILTATEVIDLRE